MIAERDKYGANDVPVGLTGWAQINGRDELEITDKARLDGEYAQRIGLPMDVHCLLGTVFAVLRGQGVVEGGIDGNLGTSIEQEEEASSE